MQCMRKVEAKIIGRIFDIDLRFTLPGPESKILALGWRRNAKEQILRFELNALPFVRATFSRLHITLLERA